MCQILGNNTQKTIELRKQKEQQHVVGQARIAKTYRSFFLLWGWPGELVVVAYLKNLTISMSSISAQNVFTPLVNLISGVKKISKDLGPKRIRSFFLLWVRPPIQRVD